MFWFCLMTVTLLLACKPSGMKHFGNMQISRGKTADDVIFSFFSWEDKQLMFYIPDWPRIPIRGEKQVSQDEIFFRKKFRKFSSKYFFSSGRIGILGVTLEWEAALECQTLLCFVAAVELLRCSMWLVSII